jgi:hypothetical protein
MAGLGILVYEIIIYGSRADYSLLSLSFMPAFFGICLLGSPSFFVSWAFLSVINRTYYSQYEKLFLWYLSVIISIIVNLLLISFLIGREFISLETILLFWPAYTAAVITITIRLKQFFSLTNKNTDHETQLV